MGPVNSARDPLEKPPQPQNTQKKKKKNKQMQTHPFSSVPKRVLSLRLRERDDFAGSKQVIQGGKKKILRLT